MEALCFIVTGITGKSRVDMSRCQKQTGLKALLYCHTWVWYYSIGQHLSNCVHKHLHSFLLCLRFDEQIGSGNTEWYSIFLYIKKAYNTKILWEAYGNKKLQPQFPKLICPSNFCFYPPSPVLDFNWYSWNTIRKTMLRALQKALNMAWHQCTFHVIKFHFSS